MSYSESRLQISLAIIAKTGLFGDNELIQAELAASLDGYPDERQAGIFDLILDREFPLVQSEVEGN